MGSILSKGIGSLVLKEYTDWNRIKNIAKRNGIYTAAGVAKLIVEHSPIKSVGEMKLQWAKRIYLAREKGIVDIIIDPGFGFGKTLDHNYTIMKKIEKIKQMDMLKIQACP